MTIATWNLNHQAGTRRVRPEAADAATTFGADVLVFTEFFPREHEDRFRAALAHAGWSEQVMSSPTSEVANRILIASKLPLAPMIIELPTFDQQFPANLLGVTLPSLGLSVLGIRVPAYTSASLLSAAWDWIEAMAASIRNPPFIIAGDLNVQTSSKASRGGDHFRRILASGWHRAAPGGATFFGYKGKTSQIDHILATNHCIISDAVCVRDDALSDHAAVKCRVELAGEHARR